MYVLTSNQQDGVNVISLTIRVINARIIFVALVLSLIFLCVSEIQLITLDCNVQAVNCFFGLNQYLTQNTVCFSHLFLRPQPVPHTDRTMSQSFVSSASASTSRRPHSVSVIRPQPVPHTDRTLSQSFVSSASASTSLSQSFVFSVSASTSRRSHSAYITKANDIGLYVRTDNLLLFFPI